MTCIAPLPERFAASPQNELAAGELHQQQSAASTSDAREVLPCMPHMEQDSLWGVPAATALLPGD